MAEPRRYVEVTGSDAQRGRALGRAVGRDIARLHASYGDNLPAWTDSARRFIEPMQRCTPRALAEITAIAEGADLPFDDLLLVNVLYEYGKHQRASFSNCTGFAVEGDATADGRLLCGQNNDELPSQWLDGAADHVVHHHGDDGLQTLIYTHPGVAAYMGMNSAGLCLLWMGVDDGARAFAVPTAALMREVLFLTDLDEAVDFMQSIPHSLPNNFLLAQPGRGVCSIEVSPAFYAAQRNSVRVCHANNFIDPAFTGTDILKPLPADTSCERLARMEALLAEHTGRLDIAAAQRILADHDGAPRSLCVHPHGTSAGRTMAAMVFDPQAGDMHIAFGNGCETPWERYSFR